MYWMSIWISLWSVISLLKTNSLKDIENFVIEDDNFFYVYTEENTNEHLRMYLSAVFVKTAAAFKEIVIDNIIHRRTKSKQSMKLHNRLLDLER